MIFNPFENRLCRDVRNDLGHGFVKAVIAKDITPFRTVIRQYQSQTARDHINTYIRHRENCLKKVFDHINAYPVKPDENKLIPLLLWNFELFFEFHEWLEKKWTAACGNDKKALQALILAAVVYEQLEYGRIIPAKKVALKAVLLFKEHKSLIPELFDADVFILKLTALGPVPPKFIPPDEMQPLIGS